MLIIDASGSMANNDAGGKTRMEAAKDAGKKFVDEAGELGLVTYGSKVGSDPALKEKGCADIDVVSKPAKGNAAKMKAEIDKLQLSGYTPIGNSLRKAAEQFGESRVPSSSSLTASTPAPRRLPGRSQRNLKKRTLTWSSTRSSSMSTRSRGPNCSASLTLRAASTPTYATQAACRRH